MRTSPLALVLVLCCTFAGHGAAADVDVDAKACQKQMEALLLPDVDCVLELKPGPEASRGIPDALAALVPGMTCRVVIKFRKAQIYSEWISDTQARLPDLPVACTLSAGGQIDQFTTSFRIECVRTDGHWTCSPILHDTRGLGILGRPLENYVNHSEALRAALTKAVVGN